MVSNFIKLSTDLFIKSSTCFLLSLKIYILYHIRVRMSIDKYTYF